MHDVRCERQREQMEESWRRSMTERLLAADDAMRAHAEEAHATAAAKEIEHGALHTVRAEHPEPSPRPKPKP